MTCSLRKNLNPKRCTTAASVPQQGFNPPVRRREVVRNRCNCCSNRETLCLFGYQSAFSPKARCNVCASRDRSSRPCFNPLPAQRPDATAHVPKMHSELEVSIRFQPKGQMQRAEGCWSARSLPSFNPLPAQRPDATARVAKADHTWMIRSKCANLHISDL
jgi:hypothetical protein